MNAGGRCPHYAAARAGFGTRHGVQTCACIIVPGIGMIAATGGAGILFRTDSTGVWLSAPFGSGLGWHSTKLPLLVNRKNAYWTSERLAFVQTAVAAVTALALTVRIHARGRQG